MEAEVVMGTEGGRRSEPLKVASTATDGITVITVTGEIDQYNTGPLIEALDPGALAGRPRVVVDMLRVSFLDSAGVNVFLFAHRDLAEAGGWLRLAGLSGSVLRILQLGSIDTVLDCRASLRDVLTP
ncbi:STAS domain-containing protein [Streptomyces sp900105245]|uniref:Anti-sigma factor antagonist n=1 Tax=Streptomyces sp. 900105245 TaxID=3154379 RepID=A0ABV1UI12_9ACTN